MKVLSVEVARIQLHLDTTESLFSSMGILALLSWIRVAVSPLVSCISFPLLWHRSSAEVRQSYKEGQPFDAHLLIEMRVLWYVQSHFARLRWHEIVEIMKYDCKCTIGIKHESRRANSGWLFVPLNRFVTRFFRFTSLQLSYRISHSRKTKSLQKENSLLRSIFILFRP